MKKQRSLFIGLCATILFVSCDKTESPDDRWKLDNEAQFAKITASSDYTRFNSTSTAGYIMYKEIESGNGETPTFDQQVKILYEGWFKRDWLREANSYKDDKGNTIQNKIIFASSSRTDIPTPLPINPLRSTMMTDGLSTALQHMQEGDKWEVWIPWELGFGATGHSPYRIEPYTTLVFEVELVSIVKE